MEIEQQNYTLKIRGIRELSAANAHAVRETACAALTPGLKLIELDLSETTLMDSFGLGAIASLYKAALERNGNGGPSFRLLYPQPPVQQILELTRMHHLFEIVLQNGNEPVNVPQNVELAPSST